MSLAQAPLLPTATPINSYTSSNASNSAPPAHAFAFHGDFSPFAAPTAPPMLGRSASCGYDERSTSAGYTSYDDLQQQQDCTAPPKLSRSQTTPTSIDSYSPPSVAAANEYAQLTELWSASRESLVLEPNDELLDLFIPTAAEAAVADVTPSVSYIAYHAYPMTAFAIPQIARSSSDSSTCSVWSNVSSASSTGNQVTKIKTGSKNKKCTYAARRREVSALRKETAALAKQLETLQIQHRARQCAELESVRLARAREENQRLRALMLSNELQLRASEALVPREHDHDDNEPAIADNDDVLAAVAVAAAAGDVAAH